MKDPADYTEYSHSLLLKLALGDKTSELQNSPFNQNPSSKSCVTKGPTNVLVMNQESRIKRALYFTIRPALYVNFNT